MFLDTLGLPVTASLEIHSSAIKTSTYVSCLST